MAYWLMKSEPESYGWTDLVRDGGTEWDGVRNPTARIHLRAMKVGDEAFLYHSMSDKAVVGIMRILREAQPDAKDPNWVSVRVEPVRPISPVSLKAIKAEPDLADMELIRQSRLSVAPVRARGVAQGPGHGRLAQTAIWPRSCTGRRRDNCCRQSPGRAGRQTRASRAPGRSRSPAAAERPGYLQPQPDCRRRRA